MKMAKLTTISRMALESQPVESEADEITEKEMLDGVQGKDSTRRKSKKDK